MYFGQIKVSDKSNEITAIPKLLKLIDIDGATVTTDAMGTQYKIGNQIIEAKGNYLLALKGNQGEFHDDIKLYFDTHLQDEFREIKQSVFSHVNGDHGIIETRKVWLISNVAWLVERHPRWRSLGGIAMIESWREMNGKETYERLYYITSHHDKSAEFIAKAIRSHWHVENKLHWQLDVSFNEDYNRLRSGNAAENFALMNKIALNLLKNEKSIRLGVKNKRLKAGWDNDYMLKVLTVGLTIV
jgi:predicted transposase YbfD/YdcC